MHAQAHVHETSRPRIGAPPLPREHGAWIGLATACLLGFATSGAPTIAGLVACAAAFAFFAAKASAEHFAIGLRPERATFWLTAFVAAGGLLLASLADRVAGVPFALAAAMAALFAHGTARASKAHRALAWEAAGFFGMAGAAALVALAQGAPLGRALAVWLLVGAWFAATVPFVRLRVRPATHRRGLALASGLAVAGAILAALCLAAAGLAPARTAFAFAPAVAKLSIVLARPATRTNARRVGLEETAWTALFAVLLAVLLG